ncbi:MAG: hypothetical protein ACRDYB_04625 [Acidimicrobiales bacterium]
MSRTYHHGERRIRVRGIRKDPPDLRRLARALIELAQLEAERDAQADHEQEKLALRRATKKQLPPTEADRGDAA